MNPDRAAEASHLHVLTNYSKLVLVGVSSLNNAIYVHTWVECVIAPQSINIGNGSCVPGPPEPTYKYLSVKPRNLTYLLVWGTGRREELKIKIHNTRVLDTLGTSTMYICIYIHGYGTTSRLSGTYWMEHLLAVRIFIYLFLFFIFTCSMEGCCWSHYAGPAHSGSFRPVLVEVSTLSLLFFCSCSWFRGCIQPQQTTQGNTATLS